MHSYLQPLITTLEANADPDQAGPMTDYMRGQFSFLGIKSPQRQALFREFWQAQGRPAAADIEPIIRDLWQLPPREYQYCAMGVLERCRRQLTAEHAPLLEWLITTKSWWDTVDGLAADVAGDLFRRFPELRAQKIAAWRAAEDFWLRRTTLLFQLRYKKETDVDLLFSLIHDNLGSSEFFINKAIGWALREYSKTDEQAVRDFVARTPLAPLSHREALKWLDRQAAK